MYFSSYDAVQLLFRGNNGLITTIVLILMIIAYWKMFQKAGHAGWLSLIPFVNVWVTFKIGFGSGWYMFTLLIPFVNLIAVIMLYYKISKKFGYSELFTLGLLFLNPIFVMIIGFSDHKYRGYMG
ncbi:hypothetical protein P261_00473 [Lachnospiraceae bacterium TWA4]|nr:hypothetical protein P261_00473 [Lachnospiraceae bacterium TWA4]